MLKTSFVAYMLKIPLQIIAFLFFFVTCNSGLAANSLQILILHSYSQEYPWTKSQHEEFVTDLYAEVPQAVVISTEYLDTKRIQYDREYADSFFSFLKKKYPSYTPDLIYVTDDNALTFTLDYLAGYFATAPIIFSGVNNYSIQENLDSSRVTGVYEEKDISRNLEVLKKADPDLKSIVVVGDGSSTYAAIEYKIKQQLKKYPSITVSYIAEHEIEKLISSLTGSHEKYLFLTTIGGITNASGQTLLLDEIISKISAAGDYVIISMEDAYLLGGVLGGYVTSGKLQGNTAAKMAVDYLQGKSISQLPSVTKSPNEYIFNYEEIQRNKLALTDDILNQATILNSPPSFYEKNRVLILGSITFLVLIFVLSLLGFAIVMIRKNVLIKSAANVKQELELLIDGRTRDLQLEKQKLNQAQLIAHIGSYNWNVKDNITTWSDELYRIVGYAPDAFEPSYESYVRCVHPDDRNKFQALSNYVMQKKSGYEAEYRVIHPGGEIRHVYEQGDVKFDEQGELSDLVGVIQDITERKEQEVELESQRDFTNAVVEVAGNIIVVLDMNGCFVVFNREAEELTGYRQEEMLGQPVWNTVIPEEQTDGVRNVFENLREGKVDIAREYENDWVIHDGSRITLDWRNTILRNQAGEPTHIVALGYNVTERKAAEKQKERLQRELNQARKMEALGQLTGGIAHDFNNMLGIISGYTDLAIDSINNARQSSINKYLDNIAQASLRATELVKQMMVFSRTDTGEKHAYDFVSVINENIKMLRSVIPSSIEINFSNESNLPKINMDAVQMQQILLNICLNSKDAMSGKGVLNISLGWHKSLNSECLACHKEITGDWVELAVSDTGSGMSGDIIERIFEPFFTTKEVGRGTGLGLSMINSIMENHGGHILVNSTVGQGTTFYLLFPPVPDSVTEKNDKNTKTLSNGCAGNGEKILIVDDESTLVEFIEELLSDNGYQCVARTSSLEALTIFKESPHEFDLVITDQTMPELTGIDLITEMRKLVPGFSAILMTGYSDSISREMIEEMGIVFKNKPVKTSDLLQSIAEILKS